MAGNQYQVDPRQSLFLQNFLDLKSATFSNALQSALRAGYAQEYAENITHLMPDWLSEAIGDAHRLKKAEKVLDQMLDLEDDDVGKTRIKSDVAKFVTSRLGKTKWSERREVTGADGERLFAPDTNEAGKINEAIDGLIGNN